jgi:hypothetical protein
MSKREPMEGYKGNNWLSRALNYWMTLFMKDWMSAIK